RGLKEVNDAGYVLVNGQKVPVAHGGGNLVIEKMVRAAHEALVETLGPDYEARGLALISRDRGKRFSVAYGHEVSITQRDSIARRREALYDAMPALIRMDDGREYAIKLGASRETPFRFSMAHASVDADVRVGDPTAQSIRRSIVTPINDATTKSLLDFAKDFADGTMDETFIVIPADADGRRYNLSELRGTVEQARERKFDKPKSEEVITELPVYRLGRGPDAAARSANAARDARATTATSGNEPTGPVRSNRSPASELRNAAELLQDLASGHLAELHHDVVGLIEELQTSGDRFAARNATFAIQGGTTIRLVDGKARGYNAAYMRQGNVLLVDVSLADGAYVDADASRTNPDAGRYRSMLKGMLAEELQHVWHANHGRDGQSILHPLPGEARFTPSGPDDFNAKRTAFVAVSVERSLIDEAYAFHQNILHGPVWPDGTVMADLASIFAGFEYGRLPRPQLEKVVALIADHPDLAYRGFLSGQAGREFDQRHGALPASDVDSLMQSRQAAAHQAGSYQFDVRDNLGVATTLEMPFDIQAVSAGTRTAAYERGTALERYYFGVPAGQLGTLRQGIVGQAVTAAAPGKIGMSPANFDLASIADPISGTLDFAVHELHPLFGNPNSMIGEATLFPLFAAQLEMIGLNSFIGKNGIDYVSDASGMMGAMAPLMSIINSQLTDTQKAGWPFDLNRVHSHALNDIKQQLLAVREAGGDTSATNAAYVTELLEQIAHMHGPEAVYEDYLKLAALDGMLGITSTYRRVTDGTIMQAEFDRFYDQSLPERADLAARMAEIAAQLPYATFLGLYDSSYFSRLTPVIQTAISAHATARDYRGFSADSSGPDTTPPEGTLRMSRTPIDTASDGDQAEQNAGNPLGRFTGQSSVRDENGTVSRLDFAGKSLTAQQIALLAGSPDGSSVKIVPDASMPGSFSLYVSNADLLSLPALQKLEIGADGRPYVAMKMYALRPDAGLPQGFGLAGLATQAQTAQELGFTSVVATAFSDGNGEFVGPYVWAQYGFDGQIADSDRAQMPAQLQPFSVVSEFAGNRDLMALWKEYVATHGVDMQMTFDLASGSRSWALLGQAMARKGLTSDAAVAGSSNIGPTSLDANASSAATSPLADFTGSSYVHDGKRPMFSLPFAGTELSALQLARLARAPDGSSVHVNVVPGNTSRIVISVNNADVLARPTQQSLQIGMDGRPMVINQMINLRADANLPKGYGLA
ncbi:MAG: hypothetical protein ACRCWO_14240, partial [Bosea sp. (in: a-proteobacteria)]